MLCYALLLIDFLKSYLWPVEIFNSLDNEEINETKKKKDRFENNISAWKNIFFRVSAETNVRVFVPDRPAPDREPHASKKYCCLYRPFCFTSSFPIFADILIINMIKKQIFF